MPDFNSKIVCTITLVLIQRVDETRNVQAHVMGNLYDMVTALRLAGEGSREFKSAIIAAADLLSRPP